MDETADPFEDEVESPGPTDEQRRHIVALCRLQVTQTRHVASLKDDLEKAQETLRRTSEVDLPEAMMAAGITMEGLSSGAKVELKTSYHPKELRNESGLAWLEANGASSLISYDIAMQFGRSQEKLVATVMKRIARWKSASAFKLSEKKAVNAMRLKGWVNERVKAGADLPFDLLGVHVRRYAEVTIEQQADGL
jgi:hypothetical protein